MELIQQEVSTEREIDIPGEVIDLYQVHWPDPAVPVEDTIGECFWKNSLIVNTHFSQSGEAKA